MAQIFNPILAFLLMTNVGMNNYQRAYPLTFHVKSYNVTFKF